MTLDLTRVEAVLLDMDGTLVDSNAAVDRAWEGWALERGIDLTGVDLHGPPSSTLVRQLCPDLDEDEVEASAAAQLALQYDDLAGVARGLGADALLEVIAELSLPWAVVTSADHRLARLRLGVVDVDPPVLVTTDDIARGKPDPEGYLLAARRLGVDPGGALVVEDAVAGIEAGRAAGAMTVGLRGRAADLTVDDLGVLARSLAQALRPLRQSPPPA